MGLQAALDAIYPPQCLVCGVQVAQEYALCGGCLAETPFATGLACDSCAQPLPGTSQDAETCDDCLAEAPPWDRARCALIYEGQARDIVLSLKHGDRTDLAQPLGRWMAQAARDLITPETELVPVPLHWRRRLRRRYNQSRLLADVMAQELSLPLPARRLKRIRATGSLDKRSPDERAQILDGAIAIRPGIMPKHAILVDDVMTSGATLRVCTTALIAAGVRNVDVVTLARAGKSA